MRTNITILRGNYDTAQIQQLVEKYVINDNPLSDEEMIAVEEKIDRICSLEATRQV